MDSHDPVSRKQEPDAFRKQKPDHLGKRHRTHPDNGRLKKQHTSRDSISIDSKNIDTLYRILCPVKNIGSVLGKGGSIVNALRYETHAKIMVADSVPGANERVIIIFSYLSSESQRDGNHQDDGNAQAEHKHMQLHCPAQDALLKVHDRIAADEYAHEDATHENTENGNVVTARLLVPNNQVGCLLGKGGNIIQNLRNDTRANIRVLPGDSLPACAMRSDELVQISGVPDVVKKALYDISTLLHQHPRKEIPPLGDIIAASTQGSYPPSNPMDTVLHSMWSHQKPGPLTIPEEPWIRGYRNESGYFSNAFNHGQIGHDGEVVEEFSIKIVCPSAKIGGVIGKGGVNVRQLEQQTGASIHVENAVPESEARVIIVSSKEAPWHPLSATIEAVLQLQDKASEISNAGNISTMLLVPSSKVGCLLGQGGHIITEMRRRTKADIRIYSKDDKPAYASNNEEVVQISGNHIVSRDALSEILSRLRERTLQGGNISINLPPTSPVRRFPHLEPFSGRGPPSPDMVGTSNYGCHEYSDMKDGRMRHGAFGYSLAPSAVRYSSFSSPLDLENPKHSVNGIGGIGENNIYDFHQVPDARAKFYDPVSVDMHGPSGQVRATHGYRFFLGLGGNQSQPPRQY